MNARDADACQVPLLLQPANPPFPFVGRAAESARLVAAITRGPVVVLCGFSGVGKSGLLSSVLAASFPNEREHTLVVDAKESSDVVATVLRKLEQLGARVPPTAETASELIRVIEAGSVWLVIENLGRIDDVAGLREALALAQSFCRRARILCVCREDPRIASLVPQTITVGPMSADELRSLIEEVQPGLSDREATGIVGHAKGSPWRLLQLSMGGTVDDAGPEKSLLMLSPIAVGLLRTLALLPSSVPQDVLARATRMPAVDAVESLARRGYLEMSARGVRLHDAARPLVDALFDADERALRSKKLLHAIAEGGTAELGIAALGLIRSTRNADALLALLERHGDALRADGHAAALLDVIVLLQAAPLDAWACRLALDVGGEALAHAVTNDAARETDARRLALRAAVLAARGELSLACTIASKVAALDHADASVRLLALEVLVRSRDDDADRALLARLKVETPADLVRRAALLLHVDAGGPLASPKPARSPGTASRERNGAAPAAPRGDDARDLVRRFEALAQGDQLELAAVVARGLRSAGDPRAAASVLGLAAHGTRAILSTSSGRQAELERGHASLALGELAAARVRFERSLASSTPRDVIEGRLGALAVRLAVGELSGFAAELASIVAAMQEREVPPALARSVRELTSSFASLAGRGPQERRALAPLEVARKARARARDAGLAIEALEAALVCVDAAIVAGDHASVAVEAEQLALESERVGSRRFALEARLASLIAEASAGGRLSSTALVELAQVGAESPVVARRAAALLGEQVPLDDVDRAVLAALSTHAAAPPQVGHVVRKAAGPEWTVDAGTMRIILVDGSTVDLSHRKVLFDLLATLCTNGGAATKEQLLERAWGVREYHPLQHDNRLKVAVRKLRRLLEEVLGDDPIEAADDGYRLRGKVRFLE